MAGLTKEQRAAKAAEAAQTKMLAENGVTQEEFDALGDAAKQEMIAGTPGADSDHSAAACDGLVAMVKAGVTLRLHENCVAEHKRLGWKVAE